MSANSNKAGAADASIVPLTDKHESNSVLTAAGHLISGLYYGAALYYSGILAVLSRTPAVAPSLIPARGGWRTYLPSSFLSEHDVGRYTLSSTIADTNQLLYYIFTLWLTAFLTSALTLYLFSRAGYIKTSPRKPSTYGYFAYDGNVVGGVLQGIGMGLTGSDPGLLLLLSGVMGENKYEIGLAVLGSFLAALVFVLTDDLKFLKRGGNTTPEAGSAVTGTNSDVTTTSTDPKGSIPSSKKTSRKSASKSVKAVTDDASPTVDAAKPAEEPRVRFLGFFIIVISLILRTVGTSSLEKDAEYDQQLWKHAVYGGLLIGSAQFLPVLLTRGTLGVSSAYVNLAKIITGKTGITSSVMSILVAVGLAVSGRFIVFVSGAGRDATALSLPVTPDGMTALLAGFLTILGARVAGGCTSGHGLSGAGMLSASSFVTMAAMASTLLVFLILV